MRQALDRVNSRRKQAWDRAVFLRPGLNEDRSMYLMFLRARRFEPTDAAELMVAYFQAKRDLFGDDLLIHRITWSDVCTSVVIVLVLLHLMCMVKILRWLYRVLTHPSPSLIVAYGERTRHFPLWCLPDSPKL